MKTKQKGNVDMAARNLQIVKALHAGEPGEVIGRRFGITPERVRQIGVGAGVAKPPPKCWCGRDLMQETDGNGGLVDRCEKHGRNITGGPASNGTSATTRNGSTAGGGVHCTVKNCPGLLDAGGTCACCEKRTAWEREHIPRRYCQICEGEITRQGKFCLACAPLSTKARHLEQKEATA